MSYVTWMIVKVCWSLFLIVSYFLIQECKDGFYNISCTGVCGQCINGLPCQNETGYCTQCLNNFKYPLCKGIVFWHLIWLTVDFYLLSWCVMIDDS